MSAEFPKQITIGDKYGPAMEVTDQAEADSYFERCVRHSMTFGHSREEAEQIERNNLGYFSGYYGAATMERVQKLFHCQHPVFGKVTADAPPSATEALEAGKRLARELGMDKR